MASKAGAHARPRLTPTRHQPTRRLDQGKAEVPTAVRFRSPFGTPLRPRMPCKRVVSCLCGTLLRKRAAGTAQGLLRKRAERRRGAGEIGRAHVWTPVTPKSR